MDGGGLRETLETFFSIVVVSNQLEYANRMSRRAVSKSDFS